MTDYSIYDINNGEITGHLKNPSDVDVSKYSYKIEGIYSPKEYYVSGGVATLKSTFNVPTNTFISNDSTDSVVFSSLPNPTNISITPESGGVEVYSGTETSGTFTLKSGVAGNYTVRLSASHYQKQEVFIDVVNGLGLSKGNYNWIVNSNATWNATEKISMGKGTFTSTYPSININAKENISFGKGTFTSTWNSASVINNVVTAVSLGTGSFTSTYPDININANDKMEFGVGTFNWTPLDATINQSTLVSMGVGTYTSSGLPLTTNNNNQSVNLDVGTYTSTWTDIII